MIICRNRNIDVYVNGTIAKRKLLVGVPRQNYGNVYAAHNDGFGAGSYLSNLQYFNFALGTYEIADLISKGPNTKLAYDDNLDSKEFKYLSLRWFLGDGGDVPGHDMPNDQNI
jgi:hypothetical protein